MTFSYFDVLFSEVILPLASYIGLPLESLLCGFFPSTLTHPIKTRRAQGRAALQL